MTTSDTPMTDAKAYTVNLGRPGDEYPIEVVDAKDARTLERALSAERTKNAKLREELAKHVEDAANRYTPESNWHTDAADALIAVAAELRHQSAP